MPGFPSSVRTAAAAGLIALFSGATAFAQSVPVREPVPPAGQAVQLVREELDRLRREFDAVRQQYDERLLALEQRLAQIGGGPAVLLPPAVDPVSVEPLPEPAEPPQVRGQTFNPDTSVLANVLSVSGRNPFSEQPSLALDEAEIAFQAIVDPYSRADFYIAAGAEGVEIEEGFITFTALPANLLVRAGKMRAQFGKMNLLHTHNVPGADRPLVSENLVGGHEGLADAGVSVSHLVQNPSLFLELTGEVYRGESSVFQSPERSALSYVGRVRAYRDVTEAANLDIGASFAFGPARLHDDEHGHGDDPEIDEPDHAAEALATGLDRRLFGVDATFRYRPLRGSQNRRLNLRSELVWSRTDLPDGGEATAFGFYGLGEFQVARRWYVGGRVDRSGRPLNGSAVDTGGAAFVTFRPTEFALLRGEYRRINYWEGVTGNEFLFQLNFAIGAHGAHVF